MRTFFAFVVLTASCGLVSAESAPASRELQDIRIPAFRTHPRVELPTKAGQSPFEIKIQNQMFGVGQVFVPCSFDGHGTNCLFDTGSSMEIAKNDSFFRNYPAVGQVCSTGASGQRTCSDVIDIKNLMVGSINWGAVKAQRRDDNQSCSGGAGSIPSLVGEVFRKHLGQRVELNFGNSGAGMRVDAAGGAGSNRFTLALDNTFMMLDVGFGGGTPVQTLYDTGAGLTVMDQKWADQNPNGLQFLAETQIQDSSCAKIPAKIYQASGITVGGRNAGNAFIVAIDLSPIQRALGEQVKGILGFNVITKYNWSVDLKSNTYSITDSGRGGGGGFPITADKVPSELPVRLPRLP